MTVPGHTFLRAAEFPCRDEGGAGDRRIVFDTIKIPPRQMLVLCHVCLGGVI